MTRQDEGALGIATRVAAGDEGSDYDRLTIALHWITALLVVVQFVLAQTWGLFGRPAHHLMVVSHMSFGIILTAVIVARLAWRLIRRHRVPAIVHGWMGVASTAVHYLLYGLLAAEAVLGFVLRWAGGEEMSFFGLLIPSPIAQVSRPAHHQIGELHENVGWAIVLLASVHAAAALYHHYILHDRVLRRMLP